MTRFGLIALLLCLSMPAQAGRTAPPRGDRADDAEDTRTKEEILADRKDGHTPKPAPETEEEEEEEEETSDNTKTPPAQRNPGERGTAPDTDAPDSKTPPSERTPPGRQGPDTGDTPPPEASKPGVPGNPGTERPDAGRGVSRPDTGTKKPAKKKPKGVKFNRVVPAHGVLIWGPRVGTHAPYKGKSPVWVKKKDLAERKHDRKGTLAFSLQSGTLTDRAANDDRYSDIGAGAGLRWRPFEAVGLSLDVTHHNETWGPESLRSQTLTSGSTELFLFPWSGFSPYVLGGVTFNDRSLQDGLFGQAAANSPANLFGPHGGLGIELPLGGAVALDFEGRYTGWLNAPEEERNGGPWSLLGGLQIHF